MKGEKKNKQKNSKEIYVHFDVAHSVEKMKATNIRNERWRDFDCDNDDHVMPFGFEWKPLLTRTSFSVQSMYITCDKWPKWHQFNDEPILDSILVDTLFSLRRCCFFFWIDHSKHELKQVQSDWETHVIFICNAHGASRARDLVNSCSNTKQNWIKKRERDQLVRNWIENAKWKIYRAI